MTALACTDVDAGYDGVSVIRGVTLRVEPGEVVALLGPNGAGKTTLLLTISGLLRPMRGNVELFGETITGMAPERIARRGVAHVPDDRALFPDLSTIDNLRIAARPGRFTVVDALETFPTLRARARLAARQLSGGEQQMLALGRALVQNPSLLMVDEMSMGLGPAIVQSLFPILRAIADERGVSVLMVEQHVHMALAVADRVYVLNRGEIVLSEAAPSLRASAERLEAAYLGRA